jgi:O-antigen/teichoic acid export membrane protein
MVKFGQDKYVLRELSSVKDHSESLFYRSLIIVIILSATVFLCVAASLFFEIFHLPVSMQKNTAIIAMFLSLLGTALSTLFISLLRSKNKVIQANIIESIPFNIIFLICVLCIWWAIDKKDVLNAVILAHGSLSVMIAFFLFIKYLPSNKSHIAFNISAFKKHFQVGLSFALITGVTAINASIDIISINYFLEGADIAYYNVAQKVSTLVSFSLVIGTGIVSNRFAYYYASQKINELKTLLSHVTKLISIVALLIFMMIFIWKNFILNIWGSEFLAASSSLLILASAQFINVLFGPIGVLLNMAGYERLVLCGIVFCLFINALLNTLLVPYIGIEGAAVATACSIIILNVVFYMILKFKKVLTEQ